MHIIVGDIFLYKMRIYIGAPLFYINVTQT